MNPETILLEERQDLLIIQDRNGVSTIPRSEYHILRIRHYNGNRIFYDWGSNGATVKETYNQGVFNCWYESRQIQISDGDGIATCILNKDVKAYAKLFSGWFETVAQRKVIDMIVFQYPGRVSRIKDGYAVDGVFMVNNHGVAHCIENNSWRHLCLVAIGTEKEKHMSVDGIGDVVINPVTMTIMSKINFLLNPNMDDSVFTNQLTEQCKRHLGMEKKS